jgi:O-methyltransferase
MKQIERLANQFLRGMGWEIRRRESASSRTADPASGDLSDSIIATVRPYTMTSPERIDALLRATEYVVVNGIHGGIVECGTWRGGSMMAVALALSRMGVFSRDLYLFDTFRGMTEPTGPDGRAAFEVWSSHERDGHNEYCYTPLEEVRRNLRSTGYPTERIHFIEGRVESTVPGKAPESIALLRLDTDWYESTRHELVHLFPRLVAGGVILIDDYGHWPGCRRAVDEYIQECGVPLLLHRIDYTGRIGVKTELGRK